MTAIRALALAFLGCVAVSGACSTSTSDREACYARAADKFRARIDVECPVGDAGPDAAAWDDCKARDDISAEFLANRMGCD